MRQGSSTVYYLLGDHLGSTAKTYNASTGATTELRYHPWGGTRFTSGTTPTTRRYTGQIEDAAIGLYPSATSGQVFYNARYYDGCADAAWRWAASSRRIRLCLARPIRRVSTGMRMS